MPKQMTKRPKTSTPAEEPASIVVNTSVTTDTYKRLVKFRNKFGLLTDPEVIRLALATLLEKHGM